MDHEAQEDAHVHHPVHRRIQEGAEAAGLTLVSGDDAVDEIEEAAREHQETGDKKGASREGEARAHGDLSENAEFHAAKDRQGFIEGRISELEFKVANADIIEIKKLPKDRVVFGSMVLLENIDTGEDVKYQLVGPDESDIDKGRISITSPLGKAMLGRRPGDELTVQVPGGKRVYELVEIL